MTAPDKYQFRNTIRAVEATPEPVHEEEIAYQLYQKGLLHHVEGILTNARGHRSEIMSNNKGFLEQICIEGLTVKGMHIKYMPCYSDEIIVYFSNVPLEVADTDLAEIVQKKGGRIKSIEKHFNIMGECRYYTGRRIMKIHRKNFIGLPTFVKAFEGRTIGVRYKGQDTPGQQTDMTDTQAAHPATSPIAQHIHHPTVTPPTPPSHQPATFAPTCTPTTTAAPATTHAHTTTTRQLTHTTMTAMPPATTHTHTTTQAHTTLAPANSLAQAPTRPTSYASALSTSIRTENLDELQLVEHRRSEMEILHRKKFAVVKQTEEKKREIRRKFEGKNPGPEQQGIPAEAHLKLLAAIAQTQKKDEEEDKERRRREINIMAISAEEEKIEQPTEGEEEKGNEGMETEDSLMESTDNKEVCEPSTENINTTTTVEDKKAKDEAGEARKDGAANEEEEGAEAEGDKDDPEEDKKEEKEDGNSVEATGIGDAGMEKKEIATEAVGSGGGLEEGEIPADEGAGEVTPQDTVCQEITQINTDHRQTRKGKEGEEDEVTEVPFAHQKRKPRRGTDSDETDVIKIKTAGEENHLIIGKFKFFIKSRMKEELEERIQRRGKLSESELFIIYTLTEFARCDQLDRGMTKYQFEYMIVYLLRKYAVEMNLVVEQMKVNHKLLPLAILDRWRDVQRDDEDQRMEKQKGDVEKILDYQYRHKRKTKK